MVGSGDYRLEDYADEKGFSVETLRRWGVETARYNGRQVVRIPYYDENGEELRARLRSRTGLWWEGRDLPIYLYGLDRLVEVEPRSTVFVVEGESDCHALWSEGHRAVGVPGANAWKSEWARFLKGFELYVWQEPDDAGATMAANVTADLPEATIVRPAHVKDPADLRLSRNGDFDAAIQELIVEATRTKPEPDETLSDTGNASRLISIHGDRLRYVPPWRKWLVWSETEGRWTLDYGDVYVRELAKDVGRHLKTQANDEADAKRAKKLFGFGLKSLDSHAITGMVNLARGIEGIPLDHEKLDSDSWLLGVKNGVIDLRTGKLRAARPDDLMTLQAPVEWNEHARAPRWEKALREWFRDPKVKDYVHRVAGSALVGAQRDHIIVIHFGHGRNGKGTFTRAMQHVLGPYAHVIHLSLLVRQKHSQHDTVKADLFRKRLAVASETERRVKLDEASVKNLTGGDRITAHRMREDFWEFDPSHSLWLQTNHLPEIGGRDTGIWSRIRVVKWEATFTGKEDKTLKEILESEAPGILRWLVEGCLKWQQEGLAEPEAVIRETLAYRTAEDVFSRFESDTGLDFDPDYSIPAGDLQDLLSEWAHAEGIKPPPQDMGGMASRKWLSSEAAARNRSRHEEGQAYSGVERYWVR